MQGIEDGTLNFPPKKILETRLLFLQIGQNAMLSSLRIDAEMESLTTT